MSWPIFPLQDWDDFLRISSEFTIGPPAALLYACRGQARADWSLSPSLQRYRDPSLSCEQVLAVEEEALKDFVSQALPHLRPEFLGSQANRLQRWAIMQHYGAPTRLLDWTTSIFVAAYFAAEQAWDSDGAVWMVHLPSLSQKMVSQYPELEHRTIAEFVNQPNSPMAVLPWVPTIKTDRMIAQQGIFTLGLHALADQEAIVESLHSEQDEVLKVYGKIIIPKSQKPIFLRKLRALNITANSLFPGLDGLGRSVTELIRLGPHFPPPLEIRV
jgi:FRG domain-containing protein